MSRKEGKKELSVTCVEVMVQGTRGNEGTERSVIVVCEKLYAVYTFYRNTRSTACMHTTFM